MPHSVTVAMALRRGVGKRCPHCGVGRLFLSWRRPVGSCSHCGLVYERNPGDSWFFTIVGDRIPVAVLIVAIYFGGGREGIEVLIAVALLAIAAIVFTAPNRWGVGIALHYLSRVCFPDPDDPVPPATARHGSREVHA